MGGVEHVGVGALGARLEIDDRGVLQAGADDGDGVRGDGLGRVLDEAFVGEEVFGAVDSAAADERAVDVLGGDAAEDGPLDLGIAPGEHGAAGRRDDVSEEALPVLQVAAAPVEVLTGDEGVLHLIAAEAELGVGVRLDRLVAAQERTAHAVAEGGGGGRDAVADDGGALEDGEVVLPFVGDAAPRPVAIGEVLDVAHPIGLAGLDPGEVAAGSDLAEAELRRVIAPEMGELVILLRRRHVGDAAGEHGGDVIVAAEVGLGADLVADLDVVELAEARRIAGGDLGPTGEERREAGLGGDGIPDGGRAAGGWF